MKNIDVKSLIIGALLTSTIFRGVAAVPSGTGSSKQASEWDEKQTWTIASREFGNPSNHTHPTGAEPFAMLSVKGKVMVYYRARIK